MQLSSTFFLYKALKISIFKSLKKSLAVFSMMTNPKAYYKSSGLFDKLNVFSVKV